MEFRKGDVVTIKTAAKDDPSSIKNLLGASAVITHLFVENLVVYVESTNQLAIVRANQVELSLNCGIPPQIQAATKAIVICYVEWHRSDQSPLFVVDLN